MAEEAIAALTAAITGVGANAAFKAPQFWTTNAAAWFVRVEAAFETSSPAITSDKTKFQHVVQLLDSATSKRVLNAIASPPETGKYDNLKKALLSAFEPTQLEKDTALLKMTGLGDKKPSELLQYMHSMNTDPTTLFRALFIHQLPDHAQRAIAQEPADTSLEKLALVADRVVAVSAPPISVCAAQHPTCCAGTAGGSEDEGDPPKVNAATRNSSGNVKKTKRSGGSSGARSSQQQPQQQSQAPNFVLCKFHSRFGAKAYKCVGKVNGTPCAMAGNELASVNN